MTENENTLLGPTCTKGYRMSSMAIREIQINYKRSFNEAVQH